MKIYLINKRYFSFRGKESGQTDLLGKTVTEHMRERLGAVVTEDKALPAGEKIVLYPAYPFLTLREVNGFLARHGGSFSFCGGFVDRGGAMRKTDLRLPCGLFSLADLPAVFERAKAEARAYHARSGALAEEGAEVDFLSVLGKGVIVRRGARVSRSVLGENVQVEGDSLVENAIIGANTVISSSYVRDSRVGENCTVGPFSSLRAQSDVGDGCRIGDFVELKNARLGAGCKAAHLAYIGDARLGKRVNVGCGVVFANYNGKTKSQTTVGDGCFLGSNCNLIAPVTVGDGAFIAAGTTLTQPLREGDFCIGRCRETVKEGGAKKYLDSPAAPPPA